LLFAVFRYRGAVERILQVARILRRADRAARMRKCWRWRWRHLVRSVKEVEICTGDVAVQRADDALDLYPVWRRRLISDFNRKVSLTEDTSD
jgi:ATP phosphoribosyltransferase regulatory subunit